MSQKSGKKIDKTIHVDSDVYEEFKEITEKLYGDKKVSLAIEQFMRMTIAVDRCTSKLGPEFHNQVAKKQHESPEIPFWIAPFHVLGERNKDIITYAMRMSGVDDGSIVEFNHYVDSLKENNADSTGEE